MIRFAIIAAVLLGGCSTPPVARAPKDRPTIVSLNPCTDAILAEVAAPGQLLAISHYSQSPDSTSMDLADARKYAVTGGTVEEIMALQPDVVVASNFIAPATRQALQAQGIRLETYGIASTIADSDRQIRELAELAGDQAAGEALVKSISASIANAQPADGFKPIRAVLWQADGIVPGAGTLISELIRRVGFTSHSAARGFKQADYLSLEQMLTDPPQLLLLAGQERSQRHPAIDRLASTRKASFDSSLLYCGGPTIIRAMERLREIRAGIQ
ncbi:ABC transporter substrate-binding protein [Pontixanthobacter gangjinensis]|uniref:ABC transporter substrate-binding protein n=1 Tax=Pontixanthobacter gangjinensis TaxID=1028742 RepID=A0A6I4SPZ1_9SPHN|nr:ABC transporter substrate-binding protein [Pontixanthobacter gangjinensis]MXO56682.1 ABC transporter substrate-binding protein [Pontixanthobacter gangjinensis]